MDSETIKGMIFLTCMGLIFIGAILYATKKRKCPKCGTKSRRTCIAGTLYAQYYCKKCDNVFWLEHFRYKEG